MLTKSSFDGVERYTLASDTLRVSVMALGATVTELVYRGRPLALGYDSVEGYLSGGAYVGAIVGRWANRIGGGAFTLNGRRYTLPQNNAGNTLHGGTEGFDRRLWQAEPVDDSAVRFSLLSPDGDNGFPGNLRLRVCYRVTGDELRLDFEGVCDQDTVFCPTSHLYFNLDGRDVRTMQMRIPARGVLAVDETLIPTGEILPPEGDFAFSASRTVGRAYDHCFLLEGEHACTASAGGLTLRLYTDYPALQFYTGEYLGEPFGGFGGFAVEPEYCPDAPNQPALGPALLRQGERFEKYIRYCFSSEE